MGDFAWHPLGHLLASSSNDQTSRFWTRNRPGDDMNDQYNVNQLTGASKQAALRQLAIATKHNPLGTGRTSKPLLEIGGVNLEEIINTEENVQIADDPLLSDKVNMPVVGGNIHPERMRQMGAKQQQQTQAVVTSYPRPSHGPPSRYAHPHPMSQPHNVHPPPMVYRPPPPPQHMQQYPPPVPVSYPPSYPPVPPQPPSYAHHNGFANANGGDRQRNRDRDRDRHRHRRERRERSRSRERNVKKGSTVPGLSRIFGK